MLLSKHQSSEHTKLLLMGDSKSGKTGALASLVLAGYKLRILDLDNGLDALAAALRNADPKKLENVEFRTLRDKWTSSPVGPIVAGQATAFIEALRMLDRWKYGDVDLGIPAEWGADTVLAVDSLTFLSDAAWNFREPLVPRSRDGKYDVRAVYKDAQDAISGVLALLTSESFRTNVIVISHVRYVDNPDGTKKGYPTGLKLISREMFLRQVQEVFGCLTAAVKYSARSEFQNSPRTVRFPLMKKHFISQQICMSFA